MNATLKAIATAIALTATPALAAGPAKNVIFFLGDGMGPAVVTATRIYAKGEAGSLTMDTLGRTARIKTFSNNAQTTDSAPSMSAYMTGVKMNNEVISMTPDTQAVDVSRTPAVPYIQGANSTCPATGNGTPVTTILELARAAGKSIGAVTTTRLTHATPAATFSHICHRDGENRIAEQVTPGHANYNAALGAGVDVLLGGGSRHFVPSTAAGSRRTDTTDLTALFTAAGYTYVSTGAAFAAVDPATTTKLVGLFNRDHLNFDLDRVNSAGAIDEPSLADMTEKAVRILSKNAGGFFLMVEGGRIDHALHGTNAKRALQDAVAFDDAIARALTLVNAGAAGDTLVVVTADHDHTMTINGYSHRGNDILGLVSDYKQTAVTGSPVNALAADGLPYTTLVFGNGGTPRAATRPDLTAVDTKADNHLQDVGVQLGAVGNETHGGGDVMLFAKGPGSAPFKGTLDNTHVFGLLKAALGL